MSVRAALRGGEAAAVSVACDAGGRVGELVGAVHEALGLPRGVGAYGMVYAHAEGGEVELHELGEALVGELGIQGTGEMIVVSELGAQAEGCVPDRDLDIFELEEFFGSLNAPSPVADAGPGGARARPPHVDPLETPPAAAPGAQGPASPAAASPVAPPPPTQQPPAPAPTDHPPAAVPADPYGAAGFLAVDTPAAPANPFLDFDAASTAAAPAATAPAPAAAAGRGDPSPTSVAQPAPAFLTATDSMPTTAEPTPTSASTSTPAALSAAHEPFADVPVAAAPAPAVPLAGSGSREGVSAPSAQPPPPLAVEVPRAGGSLDSEDLGGGEAGASPFIALPATSAAAAAAAWTGAMVPFAERPRAEPSSAPAAPSAAVAAPSTTHGGSPLVAGVEGAAAFEAPPPPPSEGTTWDRQRLEANRLRSQLEEIRKRRQQLSLSGGSASGSQQSSPRTSIASLSASVDSASSFSGTSASASPRAHDGAAGAASTSTFSMDDVMRALGMIAQQQQQHAAETAALRQDLAQFRVWVASSLEGMASVLQQALPQPQPQPRQPQQQPQATSTSPPASPVPPAPEPAATAGRSYAAVAAAAPPVQHAPRAMPAVSSRTAMLLASPQRGEPAAGSSSSSRTSPHTAAPVPPDTGYPDPGSPTAVEYPPASAGGGDDDGAGGLILLQPQVAPAGASGATPGPAGGGDRPHPPPAIKAPGGAGGAAGKKKSVSFNKAANQYISYYGVVMADQMGEDLTQEDKDRMMAEELQRMFAQEARGFEEGHNARGAAQRARKQQQRKTRKASRRSPTPHAAGEDAGGASSSAGDGGEAPAADLTDEQLALQLQREEMKHNADPSRMERMRDHLPDQLADAPPDGTPGRSRSGSGASPVDKPLLTASAGLLQRPSITKGWMRNLFGTSTPPPPTTSSA